MLAPRSSTHIYSSLWPPALSTPGPTMFIIVLDRISIGASHMPCLKWSAINNLHPHANGTYSPLLFNHITNDFELRKKNNFHFGHKELDIRHASHQNICQLSIGPFAYSGGWMELYLGCHDSGRGLIILSTGKPDPRPQHDKPSSTRVLAKAGHRSSKTDGDPS